MIFDTGMVETISRDKVTSGILLCFFFIFIPFEMSLCKIEWKIEVLCVCVCLWKNADSKNSIRLYCLTMSLYSFYMLVELHKRLFTWYCDVTFIKCPLGNEQIITSYQFSSKAKLLDYIYKKGFMYEYNYDRTNYKL